MISETAQIEACRLRIQIHDAKLPARVTLLANPPGTCTRTFT